MELAAATIAAVYKERWQIELLFRVVKQVATSKNLCGDFGQCAEDATLDGADPHAAGEILTVEVKLCLLALESDGAAAPATVCLPRSAGMGRQSFRATADSSNAARAVGIAASLSGLNILTAEMTSHSNVT
jgi:hypothetical protein